MKMNMKLALLAVLISMGNLTAMTYMQKPSAPKYVPEMKKPAEVAMPLPPAPQVTRWQFQRFRIVVQNMTGQPLYIQVKGKGGNVLIEQTIGVNIFSMSFMPTLWEWPITVGFSVPGSELKTAQFTQEQFAQELQKTGFVIPQDYKGIVGVGMAVQQKGITYKGALAGAGRE
jgi:hypothetical protein